MSARLDDVVVPTALLRRPRGQASRLTRSRLVRMAVATVVTWTLLLVVAVSSVLVLHQRNGVVSDEARSAESANVQVSQLMTDSETGIRGYLLTGDATFLQPYELGRGSLELALSRLDAIATADPAVTAAVQVQRDAVSTWLTTVAVPTIERNPAAATPAAQVSARTTFDSFRRVNADLGGVLRSHTAAAVRTQRLTTGIGLTAIGLIAVLGMIVLVRPTLRTIRQISRPMEDLSRTVEALQSGDLSARADTSHASGEMLGVAEALNGFADHNAEARNRLAEEIRLSQVVVDLSVALTTTLDLDDVAREVVQRVSTELSSTAWVRAFDVATVDRDHGRASYPVQLDSTPPAGLVDAARRINEHCWQRQTCALVTRDRPGVPTLVTAEEGQWALDYVAVSGASALLFVPIGAGEEALGYVTLGRTAEQPVWSELEQHAALQVGREVGRAVLIARLFERDQDLIGKLSALEVRQNDFVTMASHALRTPLASIAGHLEIMRSGDLGHYGPELESSMVAIERNSRRLNRLADDFLLLSRLEDGTSTHRPEVVDLQAVCRAAIETEAERASAGDLSVVLTVHGRVAAYGVAAELERAVDSLLSNAIKFSALGSTVRVSVHDDPAAETATIMVTDTGLGISLADQQRLFTRFFRAADAIQREVPGTGLGLRIAKLVVDQHGGAISVTSDPGLGTTFSVELPRAEPLTRPAQIDHEDGDHADGGLELVGGPVDENAVA